MHVRLRHAEGGPADRGFEPVPVLAARQRREHKERPRARRPVPVDGQTGADQSGKSINTNCRNQKKV